MWSMCAQAVGATTVMMERFDAEQALDAVQRYGVTHAQFVPTMFVRMLRLPDSTRMCFDLSALQRVVHAAAPCPPDVKRQMIDWWGPIRQDSRGEAFQKAGVDFDLGVVVHATLYMRVTGYGIPILLNVTGSRLCCCEHPQWSASVPGLVDRQLQNVDAIWRLIYERNNPTVTHCARVVAVASDYCDRAVARLRQFLCSGT